MAMGGLRSIGATRVHVAEDGRDCPERRLDRRVLPPNQRDRPLSRWRREGANVKACPLRLGVDRERRDQRDARAAGDHLNECRQARRSKLSFSCSRAGACLERLFAKTVPVVEEQQLLAAELCL
jgi:hypothetical protein